MLIGMSKWHLEKHSMWGSCLCLCYGWRCWHLLHVRWSHMSTVAFCWHGKVTRHKRMPVDVQPELVNIYFQACCCHSWACTYFFWASLSSCSKDNWEIVKPVVKVLYLELKHWFDFAPTDETNCIVIVDVCFKHTYFKMSLFCCFKFPYMINHNQVKVSHFLFTFGKVE